MAKEERPFVIKAEKVMKPQLLRFLAHESKNGWLKVQVPQNFQLIEDEIINLDAALDNMGMSDVFSGVKNKKN